MLQTDSDRERERDVVKLVWLNFQLFKNNFLDYIQSQDTEKLI